MCHACASSSTCRRSHWLNQCAPSITECQHAISYLPLPLPFPLPCPVLDEPLPVPLPELPLILPSADVPLLGLPPITCSHSSCRSCYNARLMHTRSCRAAHPSRQVGHVLPCAVAPTVDDAIPPSI